MTLHDMSQTADWSPVDVCFERLRRTGWTVSDLFVQTADGPAWIVLGSDGSTSLRAIGKTQTEAWLQALEQAEAAGMPAFG